MIQNAKIFNKEYLETTEYRIEEPLYFPLPLP